MGYDKRYREKVLEHIDKGHTIEETHKLFGVGTTTIKEWKKLRRETGELENRPLDRKSRKICPERLKAYLAEKPDNYQHEIAEVFGCTQAAVCIALKRLGMTRKKNG